MRGRPGTTIVAALASLAAAAPVTTLLRSNEWWAAAVVAVAAVALTGVLLRSLRVSAWGVVAAQVPAALLVVGGRLDVLVGDTGLLSTHGPSRLTHLVRQGVDTIQRYAAPAPEKPGLALMLAGLACLVAIVVDHLAVARRAPAAAGFPLLTVFLIAAVNTSRALSWPYFAVASVLWLGLIAAEATRTVERFATTTAETTHSGAVATDAVVERFGSRARILAVGVVVLAVVVQWALPESPTHFLGPGLGRGTTGTDGSATRFSSDVDVTANLSARSPVPVLTYTSNDDGLPPLAVAVASRFERGHWTVAQGERGATLADRTDTGPEREVTGPRSPLRRHRLTVTENSVRAPQLAVPGWPLRVRADTGTKRSVHGVLTAESQVDRYTVDYVTPAPRKADLAAPRTPAPPVAPETLAVPPTMRASVERTARDVVGRPGGGASGTPYHDAMAIQEYLRGDDFTYSLTLAPVPRGQDPVVAFLRTRRGYCVQFSTAMAMMARSVGIPARVRLGFLPGTPNRDGPVTVRRADAHMWPELYLPGTGWTRFEPTPGGRAGTPPPYAVVDRPTTVPSRDPDRPQPSTRPTAAPTTARPTTVAPAPAQHGLPHPGRGVLAALATLGLLVLLAAVVPVAAIVDRHRRRRRCLGAADRIETEWSILREQLDDLGVHLLATRTPATARRDVAADSSLPRTARDGIAAALQAVERARYGRPDPHLTMPDTTALLTEVRRTRSPRTRLGAVLLPRAGRRALADAVTRRSR